MESGYASKEMVFGNWGIVVWPWIILSRTTDHQKTVLWSYRERVKWDRVCAYLFLDVSLASTAGLQVHSSTGCIAQDLCTKKFGYFRRALDSRVASQRLNQFTSDETLEKVPRTVKWPLCHNRAWFLRWKMRQWSWLQSSWWFDDIFSGFQIFFSPFMTKSLVVMLSSQIVRF